MSKVLDLAEFVLAVLVVAFLIATPKSAPDPNAPWWFAVAGFCLGLLLGSVLITRTVELLR